MCKSYQIIYHSTPDLPTKHEQPLNNDGLKTALIEPEQKTLPQVREWALNEWQHSRTAGVFPVIPIKAMFFDMDATVIAEESIVCLAEITGKQQQVAAVTEKAMNGLIGFDEALKERVATLEGITSQQLANTKDRLTINPGMADLVATANNLGIKSFLVSGGFTQLAQPIADKLGFSGCRANTLEESNGALTGKTVGNIINAEAKLQYIKEICTNHGWDAKEIIAIGDGANDINMMTFAAAAIGFTPKPALHPHIDLANFSGDHNVLEKLITLTNKQTLDQLP